MKSEPSPAGTPPGPDVSKTVLDSTPYGRVGRCYEVEVNHLESSSSKEQNFHFFCKAYLFWVDICIAQSLVVGGENGRQPLLQRPLVQGCLIGLLG